MSLKPNGFTIVELLIVIVVIAILASITIVSYNGIQNRAKSLAALTLAQNVRKSVEINLIDKGTYPTISEMTDAAALGKIDSAAFTASAATPTTEKHVRYVQCGTPVSGAQITYRIFPAGTESIILGTCS